MKTELIKTFIENRRQPLCAAVDTIARLDVLCVESPEFCVSALGDSRTHVSQKAQLLAGLVRSSVPRDQIVQQLHRLTGSEMLCLLDGLRMRRVNGRRVQKLGLAAILQRSEFAELAANHRSRMNRVFKHLQQSVAARRMLTAGRGMPRATLSGIRGTWHRDVSTMVLRELSAPESRRERTDGSLTAAIKEALVSTVPTSLDALVARIADPDPPVVNVRAAVVLDLSGSSTLSGERLNHPAALGLALVGLLQRRVRDDLASRLPVVRAREATGRADIVDELASLCFDQQVDEDRYGLRVATLGYKAWAGQVVRDDRQVMYASLFRDVLSGLGGERKIAAMAS